MNSAILEAEKILREKVLSGFEAGRWRGRLCDSAVATAVAVRALDAYDGEKYAHLIDSGLRWLANSANLDGWGDSPESPSNPTATLLVYAALPCRNNPVTLAAKRRAESALNAMFGGVKSEQLRDGIRRAYGDDLTFSAPVLALCAACGLLPWADVPRLPYEGAVLPHGFFRFLRFPMVSYAIPALIAVGMSQEAHAPSGGLRSSLRRRLERRLLAKLGMLQPESGGFLEAIPLTAFVVLNLISAGHREDESVRKGIAFLVRTVRASGGWPIDTDLSNWVTSLSVRALSGDFEGAQDCREALLQAQRKTSHPYTGTSAGGWGWTDTDGSVPDADDTAGALIALKLLKTPFSEPIRSGLNWLVRLQNRNGGLPTFCKGWGKLPFDRSCPDLTAHALKAFSLWRGDFPEGDVYRKRMRAYLEKVQRPDGAWVPLWFGDQDALLTENPLYGTATVLEQLESSDSQAMIDRALSYLVSAQNADGGWGGAVEVKSKFTLTAKALSALALHARTDAARKAVERGMSYFLAEVESGAFDRAEPVGLYFARLWYSEALYGRVWGLNALRAFRERGDL